jgi:hypothetical protein
MVFWHDIRNITTAFHLIDDLSLPSAGSRKPGVSFWTAGLGLLHVDLLVTAVGNVFDVEPAQSGLGDYSEQQSEEEHGVFRIAQRFLVPSVHQMTRDRPRVKKNPRIVLSLQ